MRLYRECKIVERALLRHTQNALEIKYIEPLLIEDMGLIEDDLPTVLLSVLLPNGEKDRHQ